MGSRFITLITGFIMGIAVIDNNWMVVVGGLIVGAYFVVEGEFTL